MGEGRFAEGKSVTTREGKPLSEEYAQSPSVGDWDGDGDWDLVLGFISGPVKLYLNNGDFTFTEAGPLTCDGKAIQAQDGGPCVTDWDGDGILDLLLGDDRGIVRFYKGVKQGSRELTTDDNHIVIAGRGEEWAWKPRKPDPNSPVGFSPPYPGARLKPYTADWNNDGKLDLLVGDYVLVEKEGRALTPQEKKRLEILKEQLRHTQGELTKRYSDLMKRAYAVLGKKEGDPLSPEERRKLEETIRTLFTRDATYQSLVKKVSPLYHEIGILEPSTEDHGFVWVYLRK